MQRKLNLLFFLLTLPAFAALPNNTQWEVMHAGANTNGGGYVVGSSGTNFAQQAASQVAYTDMVLGSGGTTYTSILNPVGNTLPGNIVQIVSGSGCTAGFYAVTSNATTTATLDRSAGSATSVCTANLGGALATLAELNTAMGTTSNIQQNGWVKSDAIYQVSTGITFNFNSSVSGVTPYVSGYTTTRGDMGQPTIQATAGGISVVTIANNNNLRSFVFQNFIIDCNAEAATEGFVMNAYSNTGLNILVKNYNGARAFDFNQGGTQGDMCILCTATGGTTGTTAVGFIFTGTLLGNSCLYCQVTAGQGVGFSFGGGMCQYCVAANLTGAAADGFQFGGNSAGPTVCDGCTAYTVGRDGFRLNASVIYGVVILNSAAISNGGWGFNETSSTIVNHGNYFDFIATYNNASGASSGITLGPGSKTLSGDPYVAGASNNFALNNTAGAGVLMRGAGYPGALGSGGTGYRDIGTLQHAAAAGAGMTSYPIIH